MYRSLMGRRWALIAALGAILMFLSACDFDPGDLLNKAIGRGQGQGQGPAPTPVPATATPTRPPATATRVPPTATPVPTATRVPPTATALPTATTAPLPTTIVTTRSAVHGITSGASELDTRTPRALELAAQAGAGWARLHMYWGRVEGIKDRFDYAAYDTLIAQARGQGLDVLGVLAYTTNWNTTAPSTVTLISQREHFPPADLTLWDRYVATTVGRYKNDIHVWEIWNEPDLQGFWGGTAAQYAQLLSVAHGSVKRTDPSATVLLGGLSLGGTSGARDADFLTKILADPAFPAAQFMDAAAFHHYGPGGEAQRRMDYVRGELSKVGAGSKPVWITEVGYSSDPALQNQATYQGTQGQAQWVRDMMPFLVKNLGAAKVFWFAIYDDPGGGATFAKHGLLDGNLVPKPSYDAFKEVTTQP